MAEDYNSLANPEAVVKETKVRFTVLTSSLIRMEWAPDDSFEDRQSFVFVNRNLPVPRFSTKKENGWLILATDDLILKYKTGSGKFTSDNLLVEFSVGGEKSTWYPGMRDTANLRGTTRTLDGVSGACPIGKGILSRDGWALIDDSAGLLFDGPDDWATSRDKSEAQDWYFFGHGHKYTRALYDYTQVAGKIPLPPRYVFGTWWSRYWDYTDEELKDLVRDFDKHEVPLDVLVIDMGWHLPGWTGYTWNPKFFPDPHGFLDWIHQQGLRATLNLHPHDGVKKHEARFEDMARAMGKEPDSTDGIKFDCADKKYMDAYFKYLHHPKEKAGIDFWWMDWQQGEKTSIPGLDPLWWLNHLHWQDMKDNPDRGDKRPLIFSRWGGLGNHRYQVGFSGDTFCNWASLAFQPYFTATAGNVGYGYWSHDIGGHQPGPVNPELYTRWIQFGVFSPVLRTHTTMNPAAERRIWEFTATYFEAMRSAFQLRYELIPYIYTAARRAYDTGVSMCRPLYYEWPELREAYERPEQYLFGDDMLVAPVVKPVTGISGAANANIWLPPGEWVNWFTGEVFAGPKEILLQVPLEEIPIFVRRGSIIPTMKRMKRSDEKPVDPLVLNVFPGVSGKTRIYEDDGITVDYESGGCVWVPVSYEAGDHQHKLVIDTEEGVFNGMPAERTYEIRFHDVAGVKDVSINGKLVPRLSGDGDSQGWWYDSDQYSAIIRVKRKYGSRATSVGFTSYADQAAGDLQRGLRGKLNTLKRIDKLVGIPLKDLEGITAVEIADGDGGMRKVPNYVEIIPNLDIAEKLKQQALTLLLGLNCNINVNSQNKPGTVLRINANLGCSPVIDTISDTTAALRVAEPPNWKIKGDTEWETSLTPGKPVAVSTELASADCPQTTVLKTVLTIKVGKVDLVIPFETSLLPSINRWLIVGPFDAPMDERLSHVFEPEKQLDLTATYKGKGGKDISWKPFARSFVTEADLTSEFFVEFQKVFGELEYNAVAYALVDLESPDERDVVLAVGSDDGVVMWLDGKEVHRHDVGRAYTSREDRVPVTLKPGKNQLLVKISQGGGMWGFSVHVESPDGQVIPEITAHLPN